MIRGKIVKALSGFYYVQTDDGLLTCKARGRFRLDGTSPLVGDIVLCSLDENGKGRVDRVEPRKNWFVRPAVANVDALVFVAANVSPVTDPFLIDRVSVIASASGADLIVCINKADLDAGDELYRTYRDAGFSVVCTSAETGEGIEQLKSVLSGMTSAFTGNSGVGKSSLLNRLCPGLRLQTAEISEKLGRGKHTTRHVELYTLGDDTYIADTPGFASFELEMMRIIPKEELQQHMRDFAPYLGQCRFQDCMHLKEPGCAVTQAVSNGRIAVSRYRSYERLYELSAQYKSWEIK
ncbi:MAG: ribosome small subunit-dependent GTPase A [Oscillospiraceae bacterium]|nr:ribosome small subunit-dependent GTPase A [Oscillospiraceae bacterium]